MPSTREPLALEATLRIGPAQSGAGNHRWAPVLDGEFNGTLLRGRVQSGRMDWLVDPASGAVQVSTTVKVRRADGALMELRDNTAHPLQSALADFPGLTTAPQVFDVAGASLTMPDSLVGSLDASGLANGLVRLRARSRR